jgi:hypothetical protein
LDAENMTDDETVEELGSLVVTRQDFQGPLDIIPVSDPNIFSEAQRYAQLQAVMQLAANPAFVQFFKPDRLLQRSLRLLQIPSPDDLANLPKDPKRMGPLDETYLVCSPEPAPLKVYSEQDDVAHLETHLHFLVSPMFGANPLIGAQAFGPLMVHIKDHMMSFYKKHTRGAADALLTLSPVLGGDLTQVQAEAKGAAFADQVMAQLLGPMIMPAMQQAQQLAAQFAPKPPVDPTVQAQIAGQAAIAQANNAAQMELAKNQALQRSQDEEKALQFKAAEQQRALEAKMANDEEERMFKKWQEETKQDANDRATAMATSIEQHALETQRQLAEFNAAQLQQRETEAARAETYRMQLKADNDAQFLVLQTLIQQSAAPQVPDVAGIIQPIIADMQANSSAMMEQLAQGLSGLHAAHSAPRVARYIKDEMGNNIGVESIIKGTTK